MKTKDFSIHSIFLSDYARLFSFLSECDRIISDDEVKFINEYLHLNFTKKQINNLAGTIDENYVNKLPISIIIAHELDTEFKNETSYFSNITNLYAILGMLFIACDGNVDPKEKSVLIDYCNKLDKNTKKLESGKYGSIDISRRQQGSIRIIDNAKKVNNKKTDICSKCGFKNRPKVKFCTNCGNKMI